MKTSGKWRNWTAQGLSIPKVAGSNPAVLANFLALRRRGLFVGGV